MAVYCVECTQTLTEEERRYYGNRCESCERDWTDRIDDWLGGADDSELDSLYDATPATSNTQNTDSTTEK